MIIDYLSMIADNCLGSMSDYMALAQREREYVSDCLFGMCGLGAEKMKGKYCQQCPLKEMVESILSVIQDPKYEHIVSDEDFVPTKSQYKKITGNKYAQKVIEETNREPKYSVGEQVKIRATVGKFARDSHLRSLAERLCFVLRTDLDVVSAVNGGKRYQVLPMMESTPIEIDERHLKKAKRKKQ